MSNLVLILIKIAIAIVLGFLAGHAAVYVFNKIPVKWLCDYGQSPEGELADPYRQRVKGYPWKLIFSAFFVAGSIRLVVYDVQYFVAALILCWSLLEIAIADHKYGIIPDQFVFLAAITAAGFVPFHDSVLQPAWGAFLGIGTMLAVALIGKLLFKQESLGFGDIKLFAAMGLALGFHGTLTVLIFSSISSAAYLSVLMIRGKIKKEDMVPIGPCICASGIFYVVFVWPLL